MKQHIPEWFSKSPGMDRMSEYPVEIFEHDKFSQTSVYGIFLPTTLVLFYF